MNDDKSGPMKAGLEAVASMGACFAVLNGVITTAQRVEDRITVPVNAYCVATITENDSARLAARLVKQANAFIILLAALKVAEAELEQHMAVPGVKEHIMPCVKGAIEEGNAALKA